MFCPNCGKQISDQAAACPNCGHPILTNKKDEVIDTKPISSNKKDEVVETKIKSKKKLAFIFSLIGSSYSLIFSLYWFSLIDGVKLVFRTDITGESFLFLVSSGLGFAGAFLTNKNNKKGKIFLLIATILAGLCMILMTEFSNLFGQSFIAFGLFLTSYILAIKYFKE